MILKYKGELLREGVPTVLFIPGGLTSPAVFDGLGVFLPCQFAVINWMESDGPWELEQVGIRVLEFIEAYKLGPVILCGYSAGGSIAMSAAIADQAGLVKGLFISNTGANAKAHSDPDLPNRIMAFWPQAEIIESFIKRCFARECPKALHDILFAYAISLQKEAAYACTVSARQIDLEPRLSEIRCPVHLAHGKDDKVRRECHVEVLRNGIPNIEVTYLNGGHTIMIEDHEQYKKELLEFTCRIFAMLGH